MKRFLSIDKLALPTPTDIKLFHIVEVQEVDNGIYTVMPLGLVRIEGSELSINTLQNCTFTQQQFEEIASRLENLLAAYKD